MTETALYIRHSEHREESLSTNAREGSYAKVSWTGGGEAARRLLSFFATAVTRG
jgi:hypothetical protein